MEGEGGYARRPKPGRAMERQGGREVGGGRVAAWDPDFPLAAFMQGTENPNVAGRQDRD